MLTQAYELDQKSDLVLIIIEKPGVLMFLTAVNQNLRQFASFFYLDTIQHLVIGALFYIDAIWHLVIES